MNTNHKDITNQGVTVKREVCVKKSRAYVLLAALVVFICICTASLTEGRLPLKREALTLQNDNLRAMRIELTAEEIAQYADECNLPVGEYLCTLMEASLKKGTAAAYHELTGHHTSA